MGIYETQEDVVVIFRLVKFLLSIKLGWARRISITPGVTKGEKKVFGFVLRRYFQLEKLSRIT